MGYTIVIPLRQFTSAFVRLPRQMPRLEKRTQPTDANVIEGCWWGQEPVFHAWAFWSMLVAYVASTLGNSQNIFQKNVGVFDSSSYFLTWTSCLNMKFLFEYVGFATELTISTIDPLEA